MRSLSVRLVGWGREPQGIVGAESDAHYQTQPGGFIGNSHVRTGHEPHGRPGETLVYWFKLKDFNWFMIITVTH